MSDHPDKQIPIHEFPKKKHGKLQVRYESLELREKTEDAVSHRHDYFEIFFFTKGGGTHYIDFREYPVEDHSIHFIYPGQVHLLKRAPGSHGGVIHFHRTHIFTCRRSTTCCLVVRRLYSPIRAKCTPS